MSINETALTSLNLPAKWAAASSEVVKAIREASSKTGVSFDYLMDKANTESSFKADIKAKTSSATGLFQFIDSTWLQTIKEHGEKYGLGDLVSKIDSDPAAKRQALDLRKDPEMAAVMTAEATKDNKYYLETSVGGEIGQNELYLAHFLGANGASKFLNAKNKNPDAPAADLFGSAAHANRNVFYEPSGKKRSLNDVYAFFAKKMSGEGANENVVAADASAVKPNASPVFQTTTASMSPIDLEFTARFAGARLQNAALGNSTLSWTSAFTGQRDMSAIQRNFMDMALGNSEEKTEQGTSREGNLLAPITAMMLARLNDLHSNAEEQKS
jgi:hypothetical protein